MRWGAEDCLFLFEGVWVEMEWKNRRIYACLIYFSVDM
jgi:hypothetical protein